MGFDISRDLVELVCVCLNENVCAFLFLLTLLQKECIVTCARQMKAILMANNNHIASALLPCLTTHKPQLNSSSSTSIHNCIYKQQSDLSKSCAHYTFFAVLSRLLIYFYIIFYSSATLEDTWGCHQFAVVATFCTQNHHTVTSDLYHFFSVNENVVTFGAVGSTVAAIKHRKFSLISLSFNIKMKTVYKTVSEYQREMRTRPFAQFPLHDCTLGWSDFYFQRVSKMDTARSIWHLKRRNFCSGTYAKMSIPIPPGEFLSEADFSDFLKMWVEISQLFENLAEQKMVILLKNLWKL